MTRETAPPVYRREVRWSCLLVLALSGCAFELTTAQPDDAVVVDDADGDTVPDAVDNCPQLANLDQRNHDGDLKGDACDGCPHLTSSTDPDIDGDGVGDACDPNASSPTELRFGWTGFDDPMLPNGWVADSATWSIAGGKLRLDATGRIVTVGPAAATVATLVASGSQVVMLGAPFDNAGNTVYPTLGTATGYVLGTQEYACFTFKDSTNHLAATAYFSGSNRQSNVTWLGDFSVGAMFEVVQKIVGNNRCEILRVAPASVTATDNEQIGPSATGRAVAFAATSIVEVDYVFIVAAR